MVDALKKLILRLFPELTSGYHLPRFARVVAVADPPAAGATATAFRPYLAVDLAVLDSAGKPDPALPVFPAVPVPVGALGPEAGSLAIPAEGSLVVVGFVRALPHQPVIQCVLPHGATLPGLDYGELLHAHSADSYQRFAANGDIERRTHGAIVEESLSRAIDALDVVEQYQRRTAKVAEHDIEEVSGIKRIEALGALRLVTGGSANLSAADNLNLTTASDLNETVGRIKNSIAKERQRLLVNAGGKLWIGDDGTNVLQILSDLIALVQSLATAVSSHGHPSLGAPPTSSATFTNQASQAGTLKGTLDPLKE